MVCSFMGFMCYSILQNIVSPEGCLCVVSCRLKCFSFVVECRLSTGSPIASNECILLDLHYNNYYTIHALTRYQLDTQIRNFMPLRDTSF